MRIAISGGDGPIGRALQKTLAIRSIECRALISSKPSSEAPIAGDYLIGDETNSDTVEALLEGADALVHLGRVDVPQTEDLCQSELAGQASLIPAAHKRGIEMHYLSSSEVFTPPGDPATTPLDEEAPVEPSTPLGVAKVMWEQTLRIWGEHKGLRYVVYRVPTAVPEYLIYNGSSARYLRAGFKTGEIFPHAYDDGRRWGACYVHAEDIAKLIADAIGYSEAFGEIFHVAANHWISEYELAEMSYRVLGDFMIPCKMRSTVADTAGDLLGDVWLDNKKARRLLNLDVANSVERLMTKLRLWIDDFGSTARLHLAK